MIVRPENMLRTPEGEIGMDVLSDLLRVTRLTGGVYLQAEFTADWCVAARMTPELSARLLDPPGHQMPFHYVAEGELKVAVGAKPPVSLHAGQIVLFPHNDLHVMGSNLKLAPIPLGRDNLPRRGVGLRFISHGQGGAGTRLICGYLGCDSRPENPVIAALPRALTFSVPELMRSTFEYAARECESGRPGSDTVLAKLSELIFVEAVRSYVEAAPQTRGWLAALTDPVLARALALLHADVARPWNVEDLARKAGISRSVLAERFTRTIGMAPMRYLAHWRMQVAAHELKTSRASLARIAERIGYESEAAFSHAFKKAFGKAPAGWRRLAA
jgi:AraC-like DNA-binding protein